MDKDIHSLSKALRVIGILCLVESSVAMISYQTGGTPTLNIFSVVILIIGAISFPCIYISHRLRRILMKHTGEEPELF